MNGKITISRASDDRVYIRIEDSTSGVEFVEVSMSLAAFGSAVTGHGCQDVLLKVRGLGFVGKTRVTEKRSIDCPLRSYDRGELTNWLKENAQEEGWLLDTYLGSQSSIGYHNGKTRLNYSVTKYVEAEARK